MSDKIKSEIFVVLGAMAAAVAGAAPDGWASARLRGSINLGGNATMVLTYDGKRAQARLDLSESLVQLYRLVNASPDKLRFTLECEAAGAYRAQIGDIQKEATVYLRDHEIRYRDRGDEQEGPSDPTPAGDPREAVRLFREYMRRRAEIIGHEERLPEPATEEEVAELEEDLGYSLPPDLRALYGICNGDNWEDGLFDGHPWFSIDAINDTAAGGGVEEWTDVALSWEYEPHRTLIRDSDPAGAVKRSIMRPGWIPFADSTGGDFLAVDMDPGPMGRPGQVIMIGTHYSSGPLYIADSVTSLLQRLIEALDDATYERDDLSYEADLPTWHEVEAAACEYASGTVSHTARPLVQEFRASDVDDLAFVRSAPNLHGLRVETSAELDLSPLNGLPLETLELEGPSFDLEVLRGHDELRTLTLISTRPVDLAPLEALPRLWALDISGADVESIETIATLEGLQYLAVRGDQWERIGHLDPDVVAIKPSAARGSAVNWDMTEAEPPRSYSGRF